MATVNSILLTHHKHKPPRAVICITVGLGNEDLKGVAQGAVQLNIFSMSVHRRRNQGARGHQPPPSFWCPSIGI